MNKLSNFSKHHVHFYSLTLSNCYFPPVIVAMILVSIFCLRLLDKTESLLDHDISLTRMLKNTEHGHKMLFPLNLWDYLGSFLAAIGLILAASGGIGGGGIVVPVLILIFHFHSKQAIPLSNVATFGGSISNMILNIPKRHPDADRPLLDWSLISIMQPLTLAGAIIGTYLSVLFPDFILGILLVIVLSYTAYLILNKAMEQYRKEGYESVSNVEDPIIISQNQDAQQEIHESQSNKEVTNQSAAEAYDEKLLERDRQQILDEEKLIPKKKVMWICILFVVVIILSISKIAVNCGSAGYWLMTAIMIVWIVGISLYMRKNLISEWREKTRIKYVYAKGDVEWNEHNTIKYPVICIIAGLVAGMFGIGGGIVFGPLMLEMGVHPLVAYATSSAMIFFTSIAATTSYIAFGALVFDYGIYLFILGLIATAFGQIVVGYFIHKYKRISFVTFTIGLVIGVSAILLIYDTISKFLHGVGATHVSLCKNEI